MTDKPWRLLVKDFHWMPFTVSFLLFNLHKMEGAISGLFYLRLLSGSHCFSLCNIVLAVMWVFSVLAELS